MLVFSPAVSSYLLRIVAIHKAASPSRVAVDVHEEKWRRSGRLCRHRRRNLTIHPSSTQLVSI